MEKYIRKPAEGCNKDRYPYFGNLHISYTAGTSIPEVAKQEKCPFLGTVSFTFVHYIKSSKIK